MEEGPQRILYLAYIFKQDNGSAFCAPIFLCLIFSAPLSCACVRTHIRTHKRNNRYFYLLYYIYIENKNATITKKRKKQRTKERKIKESKKEITTHKKKINAKNEKAKIERETKTQRQGQKR